MNKLSAVDLGEFVTVRQAAERMRVSPDTIRLWCRKGLLQPYVLLGRWLVRQSDLDAMKRPRVGNPDWIRAGEERVARLRAAQGAERGEDGHGRVD